MGRHSAPDDTDEDLDLDGGAVDGGRSTAVAIGPTAAELAGRHSHRTAARPRPGSAADVRDPDEPDSDDGPPPVEGLSLLDDAFGPDPEASEATDAPTVGMEPVVDEAVVDEPVVDEPVAQEPVGDEPAQEPVAPVAPATAPPARSGHATSADLALIRTHGDVRARVIAAVLAPFVVFVAVFAVRNDLDVHSLVWIWIPAVVAGVLVGALLDAGHKRYAGEPER